MRVLVIQLKRLGDLVLTTPVFAALRAANPNVKITLALAESSAGLAPILEVDEVIRVGGDRGTWGRLLRGGFEVSLDFTGTDRSMLVSAISRAKRRITYSRFASKAFRRWIYTDFLNSDVARRHTADHHTDLLRPLGIEVENIPSALKLDAARPAKLTGPYVLLHAGTARREKYWEANRWAQVADWLRETHGLPVFLTGGRAVDEQAHLEQIRSASQPGLTDLSGQLSLVELAEAIAGAALLVSVDSVPIHLADATRTPVVALFGPTDPFHWQPRFAQSEIVRAPQMKAIAPDEVIAAIGRILAAKTP